MKTYTIFSTAFITIALLGNLACHHTDKTATKQNLDTLDRPTADLVFKVPGQDNLVVKENTAVFIEPDSLQIEKRKKAIGEEDFYIGAAISNTPPVGHPSTRGK